MHKIFILQALLMCSVMTGFTASSIENPAAQSSNEPRGIDSFDSDFQWYPDYKIEPILSLPIVYLPNSKLDRLRVTTPSARREWGRRFYEDQQEPIAISPLKSVTVGQIFNANPFFASDKVAPTLMAWLSDCAEDAGFTELDLDQETSTLDPATTHRLLKTVIQNQSNVHKAVSYLLSLPMRCEKCQGSVYVESEAQCCVQ